MNEQNLKHKLQEKLDANYNAYVQEWMGLDPVEMIEKTEEIAAAKLVYQKLNDSSYNAGYLKYLLRFQNPLEVVWDQLLNEQGTAMDEDMEHVLWIIADTRDAEQDCELDEAFCEPKQDEGVGMC